MLIALIVVEFDNQFITELTLQIDVLLQPRNLRHKAERRMSTYKKGMPTNFTLKALFPLADGQISEQLWREFSGLHIQLSVIHCFLME